jgi:hypothetical protein
VQELEIYQPGILKRPALVVVNKFDATESQFDQFEDQVLNLPGELTKMMKNNFYLILLYSDILPTIPHSLRPSKLFNVKKIVGMDLRRKEEDKLNILWEEIRRSLDIYEQERIQNQIEHSRLLRNSFRST